MRDGLQQTGIQGYSRLWSKCNESGWILHGVCNLVLMSRYGVFLVSLIVPIDLTHPTEQPIVDFYRLFSLSAIADPSLNQICLSWTAPLGSRPNSLHGSLVGLIWHWRTMYFWQRVFPKHLSNSASFCLRCTVSMTMICPRRAATFFMSSVGFGYLFYEPYSEQLLVLLLDIHVTSSCSGAFPFSVDTRTKTLWKDVGLF